MKINHKKLAEILVQELHGCFIPCHCFEPPIHPLDQDGKIYIETYKCINKEHKRQKKWILEKAKLIVERINNE